jgi:hypothetical protein
MKRREFITLLGGAATVWPLQARAQQLERFRRIGVLLSPTADDLEYQGRITAFQQALQQLGWTDAPQRADRHPLGIGTHSRDPISVGGGTRRALDRDRGRVRLAQGRCHCHGWKRGRGRRYETTANAAAVTEPRMVVARGTVTPPGVRPLDLDLSGRTL